MRITIGFLLIVAISYAASALDQTMKKESQRQVVVAVSEYAATRVFTAMQYLQPGQSTNQTFRLPLSRDYYSGQYSVRLEEIDHVAYVTVTPTKWPDVIARQPLFLNTTLVSLDTELIYPPGMCVRASRNETHYNVSIAC